MKGSASSSWPTVTAHDERKRGAGQTSGATGTNAGNRCPATDSENWQTPRVAMGGYTRDRGQPGAERLTLPAQAAQWTTPQAHDVSPRGSGQVPTAKAGNRCLARDAQQWPTPAARDHKGENSPDHLKNGTGRLHMDQLPNAVAHGFTPPDLPTWQGGLKPYRSRHGSRHLLRSAISRVSPTKLRQWLKRGWWRKRRLNPLFVEWLMGWPPGHALCGCSATEFIHWQRDMRSALSLLPTASAPWIWEPPPEMPEDQQMSLFG